MNTTTAVPRPTTSPCARAFDLSAEGPEPLPLFVDVLFDADQFAYQHACF